MRVERVSAFALGFCCVAALVNQAADSTDDPSSKTATALDPTAEPTR